MKDNLHVKDSLPIKNNSQGSNVFSVEIFYRNHIMMKCFSINPY